MSRTQLFWAAVTLVVLLAIWLLVRLIISHRRLRAHQAACARPGYAPRETFTGTLRHLSGLPVPAGLRLGTAANPGWGVAFAKERFRYAVPAGEIAAIEISDAAPGSVVRPSLWPQRFVVVRLRQGDPLVFSLARPGRFARRLQAAFSCTD